jgi:hypothetical protein
MQRRDEHPEEVDAASGKIPSLLKRKAADPGMVIDPARFVGIIWIIHGKADITVVLAVHGVDYDDMVHVGESRQIYSPRFASFHGADEPARGGRLSAPRKWPGHSPITRAHIAGQPIAKRLLKETFVCFRKAVQIRVARKDDSLARAAQPNRDAKNPPDEPPILLA